MNIQYTPMLIFTGSCKRFRYTFFPGGYCEIVKKEEVRMKDKKRDKSCIIYQTLLEDFISKAS